ncbi:MAG: hypothetical protein MR911_08065 [Spirochaetia bacterium]|nr:hypothetical protein [Treponema sp.]MCI6317964.1 hypothetical protein [Spirochaetia bacterium]MCI6366433.1 hypothetical protein [Spirochaetia bacterium]
MGKSIKNASIGKLILQLAIGALLVVAGIWVFSNTNSGGDEAVKAIRKIFDNKDFGKMIGIVFGAIELVAGAFLILEPFVGIIRNYTSLVIIAVLAIWIVATILIDFCGTGSGGLLKPSIAIGDIEKTEDFLKWLYQFAGHLTVIGALLYLRD